MTIWFVEYVFFSGKTVDAIDRQGDVQVQQLQVPAQGVQNQNVQLPNMPAPRLNSEYENVCRKIL